MIIYWEGKKFDRFFMATTSSSHKFEFHKINGNWCRINFTMKMSRICVWLFFENELVPLIFMRPIRWIFLCRQYYYSDNHGRFANKCQMSHVLRWDSETTHVSCMNVLITHVIISVWHRRCLLLMLLWWCY